MLKNVLLNGTLTDIAISGKRFAKIAPGQDSPFCRPFTTPTIMRR